MGIDADAELRGWISAALDTTALGEEYRYSLANRILLPSPDVPHGTVQWRLLVWRANPLVGQSPMVCGGELELGVTQEHVAKAVQAAVEQIRALRTRLLSVSNGEG